MTTRDITVSGLIVNKLTLAQYRAAKQNGQISETEVYEITDIESAGGSVDTDGITIDTNSSTNKIEALGTLNKNTASGAISVKYDWIGTLAQWEAGRTNNTIPDSWVCYVIDD